MLNLELDAVLDFSAPELDANWMTSLSDNSVAAQVPLSPDAPSEEEDDGFAAPVVFGDHKRPHHHHREHHQNHVTTQSQELTAQRVVDHDDDLVDETVSVTSGSNATKPSQSTKKHLNAQQKLLMSEWGFTVRDTCSCVILAAEHA